MGKIKGIDVLLINKKEVGKNELGEAIYQDDAKTIKNVLVGEPTTDEIVNNFTLHGKKVSYTLAIPKGDENTWEDSKVIFFNQIFKTFGAVTQGIDENIPLQWNKKVMVERYGGN